MTITAKIKDGDAVYMRQVEDEQKKAADIIGFMLVQPQGTDIEVHLVHTAFEHTFNLSNAFDMKGLVAKVEGITLRKRG